jgi:hypothetical protein
MARSIGRITSAVLNKLLPEAEAKACTPGFCERKNGNGRCCKICTGGNKVCTSWSFGCPNKCANY